MGVKPLIGLRLKLSTIGEGKWANSSGEYAKFGLTSPEILDAAICAPNALNTQPYKFIVLENPEEKAWFGKAYDDAMKLRFTPILPDESDTSKNARNLRTAMEFGKTMKDVPILLIVCGKRDWPFSVDAKDRIGLAPPSPGSVYPCVQNILLACRAKG